MVVGTSLDSVVQKKTGEQNQKSTKNLMTNKSWPDRRRFNGETLSGRSFLSLLFSLVHNLFLPLYLS